MSSRRGRREAVEEQGGREEEGKGEESLDLPGLFAERGFFTGTLT